MRRFIGAVGALLVVACVAYGDDKSPAGTWKWSTEIGGQTRESTLKLNLEGDKLTGSVTTTGAQEAKIEDGKFKDGEVSFKVVRERDGQKFTVHYSGKLSGDVIKGKAEVERDGQTMSRDWEAKRAK